ncbi:MAG: hypothetical protein NNA21_11500 [Nitrospira sp.]|nr:hypothetical protein [Nitrospira sp.]MCP9463088.1 hypothetical protein [Nitrospira sp.]
MYRYLASLSFHVSLFRSTAGFEVNLVDLIALEVLRVFEPAVYQRLPGAKRELTSSRAPAHDSHNQNERTKKLIESIVEAALQRDQAREIVKALFPPVGRSMYSYDFEEEWFRELRLCHPDMFDRYFHLAIPERDISQAELDRVLSLVGNREDLVEEFRALNERNLLGATLDYLETHVQAIDLQYAVPFITALFDIGDELSKDQGGFFAISPDRRVSRIIRGHLKQVSDLGTRVKILKEAVKTSTGLYFPILAELAENNALHVNDADLRELQQVCVKKIEDAAGSGVLARHPRPLRILYCWKKWDSSEKPRQWVERFISSGEGVLSFLTACLSRSLSFSTGDSAPRENWKIHLTTIEEFVSVETLARKVAELPIEHLNDKQRETVEVFQRAIQRRQEGKPDHWPDDEDG